MRELGVWGSAEPSDIEEEAPLTDDDIIKQEFNPAWRRWIHQWVNATKDTWLPYVPVDQRAGWGGDGDVPKGDDRVAWIVKWLLPLDMGKIMGPIAKEHSNGKGRFGLLPLMAQYSRGQIGDSTRITARALHLASLTCCCRSDERGGS